VKFDYDVEADAVYISLNNKTYAYGKDVDNQRRVDYSSDDTPIGIELLCVSRGVNIAGLPHSTEISRLLKSNNIKTHSASAKNNIGTVPVK
jgi:uncharacterized protein YuzE